MIKWGRPIMLWLLPVGLLVARLAWSALRQRERALAELIDRVLWPTVVPQYEPLHSRHRLMLRFAAIGLIALALARPQWGEQEELVHRRGLQIVVALDVSNSMLAPDLKPSRLQQAKWGIRDLLTRLRGDRIALVAFAGTAFVQCPMTSDYGAFQMLLDDVSTDTIPRGGTAIAAAIETAIAAFDPEGGGDRVLMLVTDGESHEDDPLSMVDNLRAQNIRVYAVGVGTPDGELIPLSDGGVLKDTEGRPVKTALREDVLMRLAAATDGAYIRAAAGNLGLDQMYEEHMARLQRVEFESRLQRTGQERFAIFLGVAMLLLCVELVLESSRSSWANWPRHWIGVLVLLLGIGSTAADEPSAREQMRDGLRYFKLQRWHDAAAAFDAAARRAPAERLDPAVARLNEALARLHAGDPAAEAVLDQTFRTTEESVLADAFYSRGWLRAQRAAAAHGQGRWSEAQTNATLAAADFRDALLLRPEDRDARINYELTRELLEEILQQMTNAPSPPQTAQPSDSPHGESQPPSHEPSSGNEPPMNSAAPSMSEELRTDSNNRPTEQSTETPEASTFDRAAGERKNRMTLEEAEMLLDQIKAEEAAIRWRTRPRAPPVPVRKNW